MLFIHLLLTTFLSVILLSKSLFSNLNVVFNTTVCNTGTINTTYMSFHVAFCIGSAYQSFTLIRAGLVHGISTGFSRSSLNSVSIPVCIFYRLRTPRPGHVHWYSGVSQPVGVNSDLWCFPYQSALLDVSHTKRHAR